MSFDLTDKNIQDTFQNLLQKTGSEGRLYDLEGNQVRNLTIDGTLTANTYITSESITQTSSGSTAFGNDDSDSHTFQGNITASGDISASGDIFGNELVLNGTGAGITITNTGDIELHFEQGTGHAANITSNNAIYMVAGSSKKLHFGANNTNSQMVLDDGNLNVTGNITASGNISSSGTIKATAGDFGDGNITNVGDIQLDSITDDASGDTSIALSETAIEFDVEATGIFGATATKADFFVPINTTSHITASGNISASGAGKNIFAGDVGIGTNSPSVQLHVDSNTSDTVAIFKSSDSTARIQIQDDDTTNHIVSNNSLLSLGANNTTHAGNLNISSSGNVGIGTKSPTKDLHVSGSEIRLQKPGNDAIITSRADGAGAYFIADSNSAGGYGGFQINTGNAGAWFLGGYASTDFNIVDGARNGGFKQLVVKNSTGNVEIQTGSLHLIGQAGGHITASGNISSSGDIFGYSASFDSNVGIGVKDPDAKLEIVSDGLSSATKALEIKDSGGTNLFYVRDDGVVSVTHNYLYVQSGGIYSTYAIRARGGITDDGSGASLGLGADSSTTDLNIISGGDVGIGTTSPTTKLQVTGDISASGDLHIEGNITASAGNFSSHITASGNISSSVTSTGSFGSIYADGNVGIGTTSPSEALDVDGNVNITGTLKASNIYSTQHIYHTDDTHTKIEMLADRLLLYAGGVEILDYQEDSDSTLEIDNSGIADITFGGGNVFFGGSQGSSDAKVGIGTTSPTETLEVVGDFAVRGSELIDNHTFTSDLSDWTLSGDTPPTYVSGNMQMNSDGSTFSTARQSFTTVVGVTYVASGNITVHGSSNKIEIGTSAGASDNLNYTTTGTGTFTQTFTATATTTHIEVQDGGSGGGNTYSEVSVRQIATIYTDKTNNRVGIGTTSPQADLHVHSTSGTKLYLTAGGGNPADAAAIRLSEDADGGNNYFEIDYNGSANTLAFHSNNQGNMLTMYRNGNTIYTGDSTKFGIGTSKPQEMLSVEGNISSSGATIHNVHTFADGDTTPNVSGGTTFKTGNTSGTDITGFDDGSAGQIIYVIHADNNTDFTDGTNLQLFRGADYTTGQINDVVTFICLDGTKWLEQSRNDNT